MYRWYEYMYVVSSRSFVDLDGGSTYEAQFTVYCSLLLIVLGKLLWCVSFHFYVVR